MKYRSTLKVKDTDPLGRHLGFGRYLVESHAGKPDYLVDLTARVTEDGRAHGQCSCVWYQTNANPNLERTGQWVPYAAVLGNVRAESTECKHISACRNYQQYNQTMKLNAQMGQESPVTKTKLP